MAEVDRFKRLRANLADLEHAAQDRLADAEVLFQGSRYASAIAMGIYAVEITLKVAICKKLELQALPQAFEIHDLDALLCLAGLKTRLENPEAVRVKYHWDQITSNDLNDLRYLPAVKCTQETALAFLQFLRELPDGVIPWIAAQS